MGKQIRKIPRVPLSKMIHVRVTPDEYDVFLMKAQNRGRDLGPMARAIIFNREPQIDLPVEEAKAVANFMEE